MSDPTESARFLMNNEAFQNALADAKKELIDQAMACTVSDHEGRRLYLSLAKLTDKLATRIATLATTHDDVSSVDEFYVEKQRSVFRRLIS